MEERGQEGESPGMREDGEGKVRREEVGDTGELCSSQTKIFMFFFVFFVLYYASHVDKYARILINIVQISYSLRQIHNQLQALQ